MDKLSVPDDILSLSPMIIPLPRVRLVFDTSSTQANANLVSFSYLKHYQHFNPLNASNASKRVTHFCGILKHR